MKMISICCVPSFIAFALFVALVILLATRYLHTAQLPVFSTHCSISSIHQLFNPLGASPRELLASRAIPNERLVRAFRLTNTFVSSEPRVHDIFVGHANTLLRAATKRGWQHFQHIASQAVEAALLDDNLSDFDTFVQDITLRVALVGLLGIDTDAAELEAGDIRVAAKLITRLWSLSKNPDFISDDSLVRLNIHLRRLIPDKEMYPNPLDYVIPVWETLWRVVATATAHVYHDVDARGAFAEMFKSPTHTQFRKFVNSGPSVEAVITEAMRLHPPSKHITRVTFRQATASILQYPYNSTIVQKLFPSPMRRECADIGTILRSNIWGPKADEFDPLRHHPSRAQPDQEAAKALVFGCGRYRCIAASWAPMAAGIIVAAVLDRIHDEKDYTLVVGPRIGGREGWDGWSIAKTCC